VWGSKRCMGRALWDCTRVVRGCLGEEPKAGEERNQGGLERNKYGKIDKEKAIKEAGHR